jgi:hypothetical protein
MKLDLAGKDGVWVQVDVSSDVGIQGRDGRMVAVKRGNIPKQGSDGRVVGVPPGWTDRERSFDGRLIPVRPSEAPAIVDTPE